MALKPGLEKYIRLAMKSWKEEEFCCVLFFFVYCFMKDAKILEIFWQIKTHLSLFFACTNVLLCFITLGMLF